MSGRDRRSWALAAGLAAVVAAFAASACCILPFALAAVGLSSALLSAVVEPFRPALLAVAVALLALGFFLARRPRAAEGCDAGRSRLARGSRAALVLSTLATAVLATAPSLVGLASGGVDRVGPAEQDGRVVLHIDGMTCEACAAGIRARLLEAPGVIEAHVSYGRGSAEVLLAGEPRADPQHLIEAVGKAGYSAKLASRSADEDG